MSNSQNFVDISVVIPVYNDEDVIYELYNRLLPVFNIINRNYELIFIDDGSTDKSYTLLKTLHDKDKNVKVLKQSRNFGQGNSILAGLKYSKGELIIIMDSDLQDRPEDIPLLIEEIKQKNVSMAIAKWETRDDSLKKKLASWLFYKVSQQITDIKYEKGLGVFRAIKKDAIKELLDVPEITGTILSLIYWSGISYAAVPLTREKRFAGTSGYNFKKMLQLSAQRIFSYSVFPMKIITYTGMIIGFISISTGIFFILRKLIYSNVLPGWTSLIVIVSFLFGINFIFMGLLGEYIGRIYLETKKRPRYVTESILDSSCEESK